MLPEILTKLRALGADTAAAPGLSLARALAAITLTGPLYRRDFADEYAGVDAFYRQHETLYAADESAFYAALLAHYYHDPPAYYGQDFFRHWLFTPFRPGSADEGELDGLVTPAELRRVVAGAQLDFMCVCSSSGFPDQYFICLTDPDPANPTVYGTDHEVFFQEIAPVGSLLDFWDRYLTPPAFEALVRAYLQSRLAGR